MIFPRKYPTVVGGLTMQRHLYFDTMTDYPNLPGLDKSAKGSDAYCIDEKVWYVLNSNGQWIEQPGSVDGFGGSGAGGGGAESFRIQDFINDRAWSEAGIPVFAINFSWSFLNGTPSSQSITPSVGDIPTSQRTAFLGGQNITTDTAFTLTAVGNEVTRMATTEVKFYYPIFVGLVDSAMPVESEITAMDRRIAPNESFIHDFVIDNRRTAIAIHNSLPQLTDIKEALWGGSVIGSFNIFNNVMLPTAAGLQLYRVYIFEALQNTMGLHQQLQFFWEVA
jgi:hypothetical protein